MVPRSRHILISDSRNHDGIKLFRSFWINLDVDVVPLPLRVARLASLRSVTRRGRTETRSHRSRNAVFPRGHGAASPRARAALDREVVSWKSDTPSHGVAPRRGRASPRAGVCRPGPTRRTVCVVRARAKFVVRSRLWWPCVAHHALCRRRGRGHRTRHRCRHPKWRRVPVRGHRAEVAGALAHAQNIQNPGCGGHVETQVLRPGHVPVPEVRF